MQGARKRAIRPRKPRALLLDALGTLLALEPPAAPLRAELRRRFGVEVTERQAQRAIAAEIAYYRTHLDDGRDETSLRALRHRCAEEMRAALPASAALADAEVPELTEALLSSLHFSVFPDVVPVLGAARQQGLRLVVVSNWDVSLGGVLESLGVAPLLDAVVSSASAGARKPARAIFQQALDAARAEASEAIHVGDSVEEDVGGARAAGIAPILICRDGLRPATDVETIASLDELRLI